VGITKITEFEEIRKEIRAVNLITDQNNTLLTKILSKIEELVDVDGEIQIQVDEFKKSNQWLVDTIEQLRKHGKL